MAFDTVLNGSLFFKFDKDFQELSLQRTYVGCVFNPNSKHCQGFVLVAAGNVVTQENGSGGNWSGWPVTLPVRGTARVVRTWRHLCLGHNKESRSSWAAGAVPASPFLPAPYLISGCGRSVAELTHGMMDADVCSDPHCLLTPL